MYGLVNRALQDMVVERHGQDTWERIRQRARFAEPVFVAMEGYDDSVTYDLVGASAKELDQSAEEILFDFGRWWVLRTADEGYGPLLQMAGDTLPTFLENLDEMHSRVALSMPHLRPPSFRVTRLGEGQLHLQYYSHRPGLVPFVLGLLDALGERFNTPTVARLLSPRGPDQDHDLFLLRWGAGLP